MTPKKKNKYGGFDKLATILLIIILFILRN